MPPIDQSLRSNPWHQQGADMDPAAAAAGLAGTLGRTQQGGLGLAAPAPTAAASAAPGSTAATAAAGNGADGGQPTQGHAADDLIAAQHVSTALFSAYLNHRLAHCAL